MGGRKVSCLVLVRIVKPTFPNKKFFGKEHVFLEREMLLHMMKGWSVVIQRNQECDSSCFFLCPLSPHLAPSGFVFNLDPYWGSIPQCSIREVSLGKDKY